jgi:hypothetical protein
VTQLLDLLLLAPDLPEAVLALESVDGADPMPSGPSGGGPRRDVGRAGGREGGVALRGEVPPPA